MTRLGRSGSLLIPLYVALASAAAARAGAAETQAAETVALVLPECATPPYDPSELAKSLEVELAPYHLRAQLRTAEATELGTSVRVGLPRCDADSRWLTLQYGDALGRRSRKRAISLRDVPRPARARMLALVIADALRPARALDEKDSSPATPPDEEPRRLEALAPATADPVHTDTVDDLPIRNFPIALSSTSELSAKDDFFYAADGADSPGWYQRPLPGTLRLGAGGQWQMLSPYQNLLSGIELNVRGHLLGRLEWALEGAFLSGKAGESDMDSFKGGLGVDYPLTDSPALRLGPRLTLARVEMFGGDGGNGGRSAAKVLAAGGRVGFSARFARRASLDVQVEVDHDLRVQSLTDHAASMPWQGWASTLTAGLSFHI